jgi:hypothetical protein
MITWVDDYMFIKQWDFLFLYSFFVFFLFLAFVGTSVGVKNKNKERKEFNLLRACCKSVDVPFFVFRYYVYRARSC